MTETATAYGVDLDLKKQDFGQVSLQDAIGLFDRRLANMRDHYDSGEEALRDTMCGFSRDNVYFIELCIHARDHVSCSIELPSLGPSWSGGLVDENGRFEKKLTGRAEVIAMLTDFFTLPEAVLAERLEPAS